MCTINPSVSGYSRFSNTYAHVKDYLENLPADLVTPSKPELSFTLANHTAPAAQTVQLVTQSTGQVTYKLRADASWIKLSGITGSLSAKTPATVSISIDPAQLTQPGQYSSTVTILSGAAPTPVPARHRRGARGSIQRGGRHHAQSGSAKRCGMELPDPPGRYRRSSHPGYRVEVQRYGLLRQYRQHGSARTASRPVAPSWPRCTARACSRTAISTLSSGEWTRPAANPGTAWPP